MNKYMTVLFDMDGTLLDTITDLTGSVNATLHHYGYMERSEDEVKRFVGNGVMKLLERSFGPGVKNINLSEAYEYFACHYQKNCNNKTRAYPGIIRMLKELNDAGKTVGIVSNKNDQAVKELSNVFFNKSVLIATGAKEDMPKKPAPDLVNEALIQLGKKKEETIFVGDSDVDYMTAVNAGVDCILVSWGYKEKSLLEDLGAEYLVDTPEEIANIIINA